MLFSVLCKEIAVHRDKTRVSVMSFDEENHFHVALNRYFPHEDDLSAFIKNIRYSIFANNLLFCWSPNLNVTK